MSCVFLSSLKIWVVYMTSISIYAVLFRSTRLSKVLMVPFSTKLNFLLLSECGANTWQKYLLPNTRAGISDVKIFDGKIFVLTCDALFGEFNPKADPVLKLYNINIPIQLSSHMCLQLVTSDNKLYTIISHQHPDIYTLNQYLSFCELDHKMEFVKQIHDMGAKSLFLSRKNSGVVDTTGWGAGNCVYVLQSALLNRWSFFHLNGDRLATTPVVWDARLNPCAWCFLSESWDISCVGDEFDT